MSLTVEAVYENGVLKPVESLPFKDQEKVTLTIEPGQSWAEQTAGMLKWQGDAEGLRKIAEDDDYGIMEPR